MYQARCCQCNWGEDKYALIAQLDILPTMLSKATGVTNDYQSRMPAREY
jgi:hypothetical protein